MNTTDAELHQLQTRVGIVFGSRSVEHEVSIITATQLMENMPAQFVPIPLYVDKQGKWWTGSALVKAETFRSLDLQNPGASLSNDQLDVREISFLPWPDADDDVHKLVDVVIFCFHGGYSEDGTMAGLFELAGIPYSGPGPTGAVAAIDKLLTKHLAEAAGLKVTPYGWFTTTDWQISQSEVLQNIGDLAYPLFVKPVSLGSSVGISRVNNQRELIKAIELAVEFDHRIIVEEAVPTDAIEVNIAVLGDGDLCEVSISEQPIQQDEFLSYADKYERDGKSGKTGSVSKSGGKGMAGLSRNIPAPITSALQETLQDAACYLWKLIDGFGVARIDFFANPSSEEFWVGEINSPPGSMAYYLFEASEISDSEQIERLIVGAKDRFAKRQKLFSSIESNILKK